MSLCQLALNLNETARAKGFYDSLDMKEFNSQAKQLAMIHSEVSETLEALRKDKGSKVVVEEIADIIIRTLDFYEALGRAGVITHDLDHVLADKAKHNITRPKMHGVRG